MSWLGGVMCTLAVAVAGTALCTDDAHAQNTSTLPPATASAPTASNTRALSTAVVTYISGETVYLDAGTSQGLREHATVDVIRASAAFATLEIQYVSSSRAAGRVTRGTGVVVGDSVRFTPAVDAPIAAPVTNAGSTAAASTSAATAAARPRSGPRPIQGRVGLRYMTLETGTGSLGHVRQPAVDLRLEGHRIEGSPFGLIVDARAHRQTAGNGRVESSTRAYQFLFEYQPTGAMPRVTVGRQIATVLSSLGYFDGLIAESDHQHWKFGVLGGTQPDYTTFMPSGAIREAGTWLQWHNAPGTHTLVQGTIGGVGSYGATSINREFALMSLYVVNPEASIYATQEIDVNRGWRKDAEHGRALTPTSTFATARVTVTHDLSVQAGYDSRRSVRLYRDFLTPDVAFDDALRRGYWGGASYYTPHFSASADARTSDGSTIGRSQSNTAMIAFTRFTPLGLSVRGRGTMYDGPVVTGKLTSASLELYPRGRVRVETTVGRRNDSRASNGLATVRTSWMGVDADGGIGRSWYAMLSYYRETGNTNRLLQQYAGLSWRF